MKNIINIVGILLIILGIISLGYRGITYNKQEEVAKLGNLKLTANTEKTIVFPPMLGGASLAAGLLLLVIARMGNKN